MARAFCFFAPMKDLAQLRREYQNQPLDETLLPESPFPLIQQWLSQAIEAGEIEPTAMCLCTVDAQGQPSGRFMLLKGIENESFIFYTNLQSRKAAHLSYNNKAALVAWWPQLARQLRIEGSVTLLPREKAQAYFLQRPRGSQIAAWASKQSSPTTAKALQDAFAYYEQHFAHEPMECPPYWGGYQLFPHRIEFWQGRPNRFHDRILYLKKGKRWQKIRLAP